MAEKKTQYAKFSLTDDIFRKIEAGNYYFDGEKCEDIRDAYWKAALKIDTSGSYLPWAKYKEDIPNIRTRMAYMSGDSVSLNISDPRPVADEDYLPPYELARWVAGRRLYEYLKNTKIPVREFLAQWGIDRKEEIAISRMSPKPSKDNPDVLVHPTRPMAMKLESVTTTAMAMGISCHEFLFGEKCQSVLPLPLSVFISELNTLPEDVGSQVMDDAMKKIRAARKANADVSYTFSDMFSERLITILCKDKGKAPTMSFGDTPTWKINVTILFAAGKGCLQPRKNEQSVLRLPTLQVLAYESNTAIDYFMCKDYVTNSPVVYQAGNNTLKKLPKKYFTLVRTFESLPAAISSPVLQDVFADIIRFKVNNS